MPIVTDSTPEAIKQALSHFGFKPEPKELRADFTQWRKDVGKPLELYADVYKNAKLKLYSRTGLLNFPKRQRANFLSDKFDGKIVLSNKSDALQVALLLLQVDFITPAQYIAFIKSQNDTAGKEN